MSGITVENAPAEPVRRGFLAALKPVAIFLGFGPVIFSLSVLAIMFAMDPTTFSDHRDGCESVEGDILFPAVFAWVLGFVPTLLGAIAFVYARTRDLAFAWSALISAATICPVLALAFWIAGVIMQSPPPNDLIAAFTPPSLVANLACWKIAQKLAPAKQAAVEA